MSFFRTLAYLLIVAAVVLVAALTAMLAEISSAGAMSPEVRRAVAILLIVILVLLLVILFLLCLARAKERLREEKRLYREAHGADPEGRKRAAEELERRVAKGEPRLKSLCDVLVRRKFPKPCLQLPIDVTRRPDPCIYSQFYLMANGQPVTWDNPNVEILLGGVAQDTYHLQASTNYQVRVGVENASPFFDALGTQVQVNLLSFGVGGGTTATPITSYARDIPAATPFPGVIQAFPWTSPPTPGHYCIQVLLSHPNDVNPSNNEGWNNTVIQAVRPGERFQLAVPVWGGMRYQGKGDEKAMKQFAEVVLTLDAYALRTDQLPTKDPDGLFASRPAVWGAVVAPARLTIPPRAQAPTNVEFGVTVPADAQPGTRATFNISGTAGGRPLGGVTVHLDVR